MVPTDPKAKLLSWATVDLDNSEELTAFLDEDCAEAGERVSAAVRDLHARGIVDANGRRIRTDTPTDMMPSAKTDFGG